MKMIESQVQISMRDDNHLNCSYAVIHKGSVSVIIILRDSECAVFDYNDLKKQDFAYHYLLLKHYNSDAYAYIDFMKLIGKMCKKSESSKYFLNRKDEDNRMVFHDFEHEHMIRAEEKQMYEERYRDFREFVLNKRGDFL